MSADSAWLAGTVALAAAVTAAIDADVFGPVIPIWRRQVNDQWLARYRSWVYGVGFGWQIGVGVATYIMTAAVFLVVIMAATERQPRGGRRPCACCSAWHAAWPCSSPPGPIPPPGSGRCTSVSTPLGPAVRVAVIAVQAGVALVALAVLSVQALPSPVASVAVGVAAAGALVAVGVAVHRKARRAWAS